MIANKEMKNRTHIINTHEKEILLIADRNSVEIKMNVKTTRCALINASKIVSTFSCRVKTIISAIYELTGKSNSEKLILYFNALYF